MDAGLEEWMEEWWSGWRSGRVEDCERDCVNVKCVILWFSSDLSFLEVLAADKSKCCCLFVGCDQV